MAEYKHKKIVKSFFESLGVDSKIKTSEDDEIISVVLETEDTGIIIGYHGETLEALQIVLSLMLAKKTGEFKRVSVEVGDYKKNREEWLEKLALDAKEKAILATKKYILRILKLGREGLSTWSCKKMTRS